MDVNKLVVGQKYKSTAKHGQRVTLIEICEEPFADGKEVLVEYRNALYWGGSNQLYI